MTEQEIPYVIVVEIDGERHVMQGMGIRHKPTVEKHLQQIHPAMRIISLEPADPKDPIAHVARVAQNHREMFPDQEPLTPDKLNASANAAISEQNAARQP